MQNTLRKYLENENMKNSLLIVFLAISMLYTMAQPTIAADYFTVLIYNNGNPASNAYVAVWDGSITIADGYSDGDGTFGAWLDSSVRYRITARMGNQHGEWVGYPNPAIEIKIEMRPITGIITNHV
jgi:hypothetical protein